jgi:CBS domain-containing protein
MDVNRVPVVEKGVVIGIISRADIVFALYKKKV